jgi:hypothetical protein
MIAVCSEGNLKQVWHRGGQHTIALPKEKLAVPKPKNNIRQSKDWGERALDVSIVESEH